MAMNIEVETLHDVAGGVLELTPVMLNESYRKEWNVSGNDYLHLTRNGELVNESLYRVGGMGAPNLKKDKYFLLLKYTEAYYSKEILRMAGSTNPKHLNGKWTILDSAGKERVTMDTSYRCPHLVKNSCIYSIDSNYYNIETGEFYCHSYTSMDSTDYLFLENRFDKDKSRRGVLMIDKRTGTWKLHS